ncbi:phycobiliprotein lyase [Alkalinema sp. FACHB-956]|uniref:phycobiliprotein lyase n=1 Tax=Alkalinema sp. FACHB-956 TaxID=2692768 RepID=UPI001686E169|nr:phycobiliprotein lyase [Alkalinema sp. FACHB-956]MBD2328301.1 phycobiliprotein lyase [Alkalinema sp. FACHB-956]
MLSFQAFFAACAGRWVTERTYHYFADNEIERSHTEFQANPLDDLTKQKLLKTVLSDQAQNDAPHACPGFSIHFDTLSEKGDRVEMSLKALFVPETLLNTDQLPGELPIPVVAATADQDASIIRGFYLRDEGYSEGGSIAGRFTYQPSRQILEMTTFYRKSVAVDQMRFISPETRLRTIVTYRRPTTAVPPSEILLVGFGVEHKQPLPAG